MNAPPRDPYDQPLEYHCPARDGAAYEMYSRGLDRRDGTEDDIRPRAKKR
ncbi:MAG TPA: type II secretion system protein GspG [Polyangia bacterium]